MISKPLLSSQGHSRTPSLVVGILTPYTGGFYYGSVIKGVHNTAVSLGLTTFAIQMSALDRVTPAGKNESEVLEVLSLNAADAWVVVNEAAQHPFVSRLLSLGVPAIAVNASRDDQFLSSVLPDNEGGMFSAVSHLIEHGHERIVFLGNTKLLDIDERYCGYKRAMKKAGLVAFDALACESRHNSETDGQEFGRILASNQHQFTAVAAATDKLAIGVLEELLAAGFRIPEDIALVGFDDIERAQYTEPALTTVRQNFASVGVEAARTLIAHLKDGTPLPKVLRVPTPFVQRRSCGCVVSNTAPDPPSDTEGGMSQAWLQGALLSLAGEPQGAPLSISDWPQVLQISERLDSAVRGIAWQRGPKDSWQSTWECFVRHNRNAESVNRALAILELYVSCQDLKNTKNTLASKTMLDLRASLLFSWQRGEQRRTREYELVAETMARISHAISRGDSGLGLEWLQVTESSYGTLGLWRENEFGQRELSIQCEYQTAKLIDSSECGAFLPANFPPRWLSQLVNGRGADQILILVSLSGSEHSHGVLAIGSSVESELLDHVVHIGDWGAQIGATLDQVSVAQRFRDHALHDSLTGLPNRVALLEHLGELAESEITSHFALLFIDLDDFKKINDSLGHHAGDALLKKAAERLLRAVGGQGMVTRLGGDEFVVVLHDCPDEARAVPVIDEIQQALAQPMSLESSTAYISGSIGLVFGGEGGSSAADLLRAADTAMYRAKLQGRAQYATFHQSMHEQAVERLLMEEQLRRALEEEQFEIVFQPIVALDTGLAVGAEALIRWNHPVYGLMMPARFIPVAEDVGLIVPMGEWVMRAACREAAQWRSAGHDVYVSVNVAAPQLKDPFFVEKVEATLRESGLSSQGLSIELLENSLVQHLDEASSSLSRLRKLGVRVAIDDFGTGYSSLNYLKRLPVDVLKLDRSFVERLPNSGPDAAIISAVLTMGRGLGLQVIAEGVETVHQADFLAKEGCRLVQGYLLSRPLSRNAWQDVLDNWGQVKPPESSQRFAQQATLPSVFVERAPASSFPPK